MKKVLLLSFLSVCAVSAIAQHAPKLAIGAQAGRTNPEIIAKNTSVSSKVKFKTTGTPFYTEDFGSGTSTSLPTGWTAGSTGVTGTWKWINKAANPYPGNFNIGALNSTTSANGWMIYDSDSIGYINSSATSWEGWLQSPSIPCTGHNTVQLTFQQYFRKWWDSCFVDVSNNGGTNWTTFPVHVNNALSNATSVPSNPHIPKLNISSVAANQANVIVRLRYKYNGVALGGYNWLVDDLSLAEMDPVELGLSRSGIFSWTGNEWTSFSMIPLHFTDTIFPATHISSYGSTPQNNVQVNAQIFSGATSVYNQNATEPSVPVNAVDTLVEFSGGTGFLPASVGTYRLRVTVNQPGDTDPLNDVDSMNFVISDSVYSRNTSALSGGYYIHNATNNTSNAFGTMFSMPTTVSDTLTSVSVAFGSSTVAGASAIVHIYRYLGATQTWQHVGSTKEKTLTASDISTSGNVVYTTFPMDFQGTYLELTNDVFAAVLTGVSASTEITVLSSTAPLPNIGGYAGVFDDDNNNGNPGFGVDTSTWGVISAVPLIRMNFANRATWLNLNNPDVVKFNGEAHPNPSDNEVNISFTVTDAANVNINITNTLGQIVKAQDLGKYNANQSGKAVFSVADLSNGVYFYTLEANGQRITKRFVVTH